TKEVVNTLLQSGRFLILLDGLSEVEQGDKTRVVNDVLHIAKSTEYQTCRFLLSTRPIDAFPSDISIVELQPLSKEVIISIIPIYGLARAEEYRLETQLRFFNDKPLDPLLFTMAITESATEQISTTRTGLYERYFQRLLQIKPNDTLSWRGWQD